VIQEYDVNSIFHLAAILSADGEEDPQSAFQVSVNGLYNVLEASRVTGVTSVIVPSSIAVFSSETPAYPYEQTVLNPSTMYGISKIQGELLGDYYYERYGLDVRGVRFPGIISHRTKASGDTTDYAVNAFYDALTDSEYTYFVCPDTTLPMIYIPDAIRHSSTCTRPIAPVSTNGRGTTSVHCRSPRRNSRQKSSDGGGRSTFRMNLTNDRRSLTRGQPRWMTVQRG